MMYEDDPPDPPVDAESKEVKFNDGLENQIVNGVIIALCAVIFVFILRFLIGYILGTDNINKQLFNIHQSILKVGSGQVIL